MASGYHGVIPGEKPPAATINDYWSKQVVGVYTSATDRDTQLTGVKREGMLAYLKDVGQYTRCNAALTWEGVISTPFGFAVRRNVNEAARGTLQTFQVAFDTCVNNSTFLGAAVPGAIAAQSAFVVPTGGGGVYQLAGGVYWTVPLVGIIVAIRVNGIAVVSSAISNAGLSSQEIGRAVRLAVGDTVDVTVYNGSAGNITVATYAGTATTGMLPYLSAWRLSS